MGTCLEFQITAWYDEDLDSDDLSPEEEMHLHEEVPEEELFPGGYKRNKRDTDAYRGKHYTVTVFGRCADGQSVAVRLLGFCPFLYVRIGNGKSPLKKRDADTVLSAARVLVFKREVIKARVVTKKEYYGFTNDEPRNFVGITFLTKCALRSYGNRVWGTSVRGSDNRSKTLHPYEAHIEPLLRLIHIRHLDASGWAKVVIPGRTKPGKWANTDLCFGVHYTQIQPLDANSHSRATLAPVTVCSFDIECASRNREDFPLPERDYLRTAKEMYEVYNRAVAKGWGQHRTRVLIQALICKATGADLATERLQTIWDEAIREKVASDKDMSRVFVFRPPKEKTTFDPTNQKTATLAEDIEDYFRYTYDYDDYDLSYKRYENTTPNPHRPNIVAELMNRHMPRLLGDEIIQIGATFNTIGSQTCSSKWVGTVRGCAPVSPDVEVQVCETEAELLMAFSKLMLRRDPDVYTGYNVWGFDHHYLYTRAKELGIDNAFVKMSRLKHCPAKYEEKSLSSSAMGHNNNRMLTIAGRVNMDLLHVIRKEFKLNSYSLNNVSASVLNDSKHDVPPKEIFRLHDGTDEDRARIARYCVQDCELVSRLTERLNVIVNSIAMANVCSVPLQYIFSRGQGIKCTSQVSRECRTRGFVMKTHDKPTDENADPICYDGARVLEPKTGLYDRPVFCLDYASLYPTCMISHNICASSKVTDPAYLDLPGVRYEAVKFNVYKNKRVTGAKTVHYAQPTKPENSAVLPSIEETLKRKRSETRAKMKWKRVKLADGRVLGGKTVTTQDGAGLLVDGVEVTKSEIVSVTDFFSDFQKQVLNGEQLAYKITGNSLYGAQGASTSDIRDVDCAASITAVGRSLLDHAKEFLEREGCTVVYGDTDSCFATVAVYDPHTGEEVTGKDALPLVIAKAKELESKFLAELPRPHVCEYEKVYYPWILLSKKRYLGYKYVDASDTPKFSYNGIVLVRRDNCEALKDVVSGLCKKLLELDVDGAVADLLRAIDDLVEGRIPLDKLTISKTLGDSYKNPAQIAHWVLAQRIGARDPAKKPRSNDRIAYAFVVAKNPSPNSGGGGKSNNVLQGDRIETPEYIREQGLQLDYSFYLEHQIMTPVCQILASVVERLPKYNLPQGYWRDLWNSCYENNAKKYAGDQEAAEGATRKYVDEEKAKYVKRLIFDPVITKLNNRTNKQSEITAFFRARNSPS